MGAASYSSDKFIAHINAGEPIQTYVAVRKLEFENYCFEITQVVCAGGRETILQQKTNNTLPQGDRDSCVYKLLKTTSCHITNTNF